MCKKKGSKLVFDTAEEDEVIKNPFDDYIEANFPPLIAAAAKVPEKLRTLTGLYEDVVKAEGKILAMALVCQKPTTDELKKIYEPVGAVLNKLLKVIPFKSEPIYNEGKAIEEAAKTANWITVDRTPMDYIDQGWQV
ncbi:MAG: hypothetical protein EZS28_049556 [Streblomastix strix]|uniref:CAP N-terminal domain-containing protein n=1 Tax=Streblomastix strix TaxID=222440 RepID=A0A5J4T9M0_9EUKA|nr:MAG: hypothetical protein EZS28_049556 [Streblomastix strix]